MLGYTIVSAVKLAQKIDRGIGLPGKPRYKKRAKYTHYVTGGVETCAYYEEHNFLNRYISEMVTVRKKGASDEEISIAVDAALEAGYRHIDTAFVYGNEAAIGKALKKWFDSGKIKREDLFIVTKLPMSGLQPDRVEKYLNKSLTALQLSYVDLYLIHFPCGLVEKEGDTFPVDKSGYLLIEPATDHIAVWKAMEAQVDAGKAHSIGLSNFNARQIKRIVKAARIPPANLQVELHVYFQQRELVAFCKALDITVCAYAPIGSPGLSNFIDKIGGDKSSIPNLSPLSEPLVKEIAQKHKKTPAQILLYHIMLRGIAVIPKSANPERIKQNFQEKVYQLSGGGGGGGAGAQSVLTNDVMTVEQLESTMHRGDISNDVPRVPAARRRPKHRRPRRRQLSCRASAWTPCSATCGVGESSRTRTVMQHARREGRPCPPLAETRWCSGHADCAQDFFNW